MIKFNHTRVYNFMGAIRNMRNSWESWDNMDSYELDADAFGREPFNIVDGEIPPWARTTNPEAFKFGPQDHALAMNLSRAGSDHAKFLRQILVSVDITAPEYWWKEEATYKVGTVENSTSMMHKLGSRLLTVEDFSFDEPEYAANTIIVENVNTLIEMWKACGGKKPSPTWRTLIQNVPQSFNYLRGCTMNYQVLKQMYHARKHHRLQEWHDFCAWVESLPYSELITLKEES